MPQIRKYVLQMSTAERKHIMAAVRNRIEKGLTFGATHLSNRMQERAVSEQEIRQALTQPNILEVSKVTETGDVRVLLRNWNIKPKNISVCLSLKTGFVLTAWKINPNDNHSTCKTVYDWQVDLTELPLC